jgi:3',5'-cyclic AMP phosphodiesterase CpdA
VNAAMTGAVFTLAHLSDPHLSPMPWPRPRELVGKRALGLLNWHLRRRREHRAEVLDAILQDLAAQTPDHVAVTGDLVNVALPGEFITGRAFLQRVGSPDRVSLVPGNHDAYVRGAASYAQQHWGDYTRGDQPIVGKSPGQFPFVRQRGPLVLIGVSTAVPTGPLMATGRIGDEQLRRLDAVLAQLAGQPHFRLVLLHHPPTPHPGDRLKCLTDSGPFREIVRRHGADLVLHGHLHMNALAWLDGPTRKVPAIGVPAASATEHGDERAAYHLFRIAAEAGGWRCEWITRGFGPDADRIAELARRLLTGSPS